MNDDVIGYSNMAGNPGKHRPHDAGSWRSRLARLTEDIPIAIVGAGAMGRGLLYQSHITPGIRCVALADIKIERAVKAVSQIGLPYRIVRTPAALHEAIERGQVAVCDDGDLLARCELADVLVESSNAIIEGARFAMTALAHQKHLVLMNAETDLAFGPYLMHLAHKNGVVYTSCDGDQHGVITRLVRDLDLWGMDLVMAGNVKGYLDRYATPTSIVHEAAKRNLDPKMCASYTDGTKLAIEMALVANGLGLSTAVPGMYGPPASHVREALDLFDLERMYAACGPTVDYVLGAEPDGGVFAVGYCDNPYQRQMLAYYKMGEGPFYVLYRPYHLCHVEAMQCIAEACLDGQSLLQPVYGFQANVYTYAKQDLQAGTRLDGIGGHTCYGLIENCSTGSMLNGLPICLSEHVQLKRDIPKDGKIYLHDVVYETDRFDFHLYDKARHHRQLMPA